MANSRPSLSPQEGIQQALQLLQAPDEQLHADFHNVVDGFTKNHNFRRKHHAFLNHWQRAYLYYYCAYLCEKIEDYAQAKQYYEAQINLLKTIPQETLSENSNYVAIVNHSLARAYYQIGVLYRDYVDSLATETNREEDNSDTEAEKALIASYNAFCTALDSYNPQLSTQGYAACKNSINKPEDNLLRQFYEFSLNYRMAVLFYNLADVSVTLHNSNTSNSTDWLAKGKAFLQSGLACLDHSVDTEFATIFKEYAALHDVTHTFQAKTANITTHNSAPSSRAKPAEESASTLSCFTTKKITVPAAIANFIQQPLLDCYRPHQTAAILAMQKKLQQPQQKKIGVIFPTGSGKTMLELGCLNNMFGQPGQVADVIMLFPNEGLVEQTAKKILEYSKNYGLNNLPKSDILIGRWYATKKLLRPLTLATVASWRIAVKKSLDKYPNAQSFRAALEEDPSKIQRDPSLYFSPFHQDKIIVVDEAHHIGAGHAPSSLGTLALHYCMNGGTEEIVAYIERDSRRKKAKLTASSSTSTNINDDTSDNEGLSTENIIDFIEQSQKEGYGPFLMAFTATPNNEENFDRIFCRDHILTIESAIQDGILSAVQIVQIKLNNTNFVDTLRNKLGLGRLNANKRKLTFSSGSTEEHDFTAEQHRRINQFMLEMQPLNNMLLSLLVQLRFKKTIIFTDTIAHVDAMYATTKKVLGQNISVVTVKLTSAQKRCEKHQGLEDFSKPDIYAIAINCGSVGEGTDIVDVDAVLDCRIYKIATVPILQAVGRALRLIIGKLATYLWLDLQIGQLNPAHIILNNKLYCLGNTVTAENLLSIEQLPKQLRMFNENGEEITFEGVDIEITTPHAGKTALYNTAGTKQTTPIPAVTIPAAARDPLHPSAPSSLASDSSSSSAVIFAAFASHADRSSPLQEPIPSDTTEIASIPAAQSTTSGPDQQASPLANLFPFFADDSTAANTGWIPSDHPLLIALRNAQNMTPPCTPTLNELSPPSSPYLSALFGNNFALPTDSLFIETDMDTRSEFPEEKSFDWLYQQPQR